MPPAAATTTKKSPKTVKTNVKAKNNKKGSKVRQQKEEHQIEVIQQLQQQEQQQQHRRRTLSSSNNSHGNDDNSQSSASSTLSSSRSRSFENELKAQEADTEDENETDATAIKQITQNEPLRHVQNFLHSFGERCDHVAETCGARCEQRLLATTVIPAVQLPNDFNIEREELKNINVAATITKPIDDGRCYDNVAATYFFNCEPLQAAETVTSSKVQPSGTIVTNLDVEQEKLQNFDIDITTAIEEISNTTTTTTTTTATTSIATKSSLTSELRSWRQYSIKNNNKLTKFNISPKFLYKSRKSKLNNLNATTATTSTITSASTSGATTTTST